MGPQEEHNMEQSMEDQNNTDEYMASETNSSAPEGKDRSTGGVIGIIIVVIILIIAGIYLFSSRGQTPEEIRTAPDEQTQSLQEQGTSDEIQAIEEDLESTNFNDLDAEMQQIEQELGA